MDVRDRLVAVLTAAAATAAFAGAWLLWSLGAALILVGALCFVVALLIAFAAPDVRPAPADVVEPQERRQTTITEMPDPFAAARVPRKARSLG